MKQNIIIFLSFFFFLSCTKSSQQEIKFDNYLYTPEFSSNFNILEDENSRNVLITVKNPWQGAKNISSGLVIEKIGEISKTQDYPILKGEAKRIICMSSTHVAMLDAIGCINRIIGVSGLDYLSNEYIKQNSDRIKDIGYEGHIDYETLISLQPDLVLLFSVNGASSMEPRLKELGIPYLYIGDYVEESPLGKAEWIIPIAETVGKRNEAKIRFEEINQRYQNLIDTVKTNITFRPKIMVNAPFLDSWFMPSSQSYIAKMIEDAGGEYIYKKNTGNSSIPIDMEEALRLVSECDYWINVGTIKDKKELEVYLPKFYSLKCVKEGKIYNNNLRSVPGGGNDCYESGVVNPDLILKDMIHIFHPELISDDFTYYRELK